MIKMIITDLDQTLLRDDGTVSDYTRKVWQACKKQGILTGIATARLQANAVHIQRDLGADFLICSNGSKVVFKDRLIECEMLEEWVVNDLTKMLHKLPSQKEILVEGETQVYINTCRFAPPHPLAEAVYTDFSMGLRQKACQIFAGIEAEEDAEEIREKFPGCRCIHYRDSDRYAFLSELVSKERAIVRVLKQFDIHPSQMAAFGDDGGDKEMLALSGLGVAMGNALPEVKAAADAVAGTNEEDGVARFIWQEILRNDKKATL